MTPQATLDKLVLLIVSGISDADLRAACIASLGVPADDVDSAVAEARRRVTLAADYNRDEQIGTAVTRLNDLYARAIKTGDIKTALTAQREMNRLFGLYVAATAPTPPATADTTELDAIRAHLAPLELADATYPLPELARIAADIVREHRGCVGRRGAHAARP